MDALDAARCSHAVAPGCCRQVIADAVLADPFEWNEAVLGKEPAEYCRWIKVPLRLPVASSAVLSRDSPIFWNASAKTD